MRSTFMGLETSRKGLFTQQSALYTTGHNISNANTIGYSRQRVNMQATAGFPTAGLNSPTFPGHLGTGVEAGSIQRIRDSFIDRQYRQETTKLGYWESRSQSISQMEDILNEPSDYGLAKSLNEFWGSLQDLSTNPESGAARSVVVQRGIAVADSFNYMYNSIKQIQDNAGNEIAVTLKDVNSILRQIASINEQIQAVEPNGYIPNDLYDARDVLLDELSTHFPIEIENVKSGGNALASAEGSITVSLKLNGSTVKLVDGKEFAQLRTDGTSNPDNITPSGTIQGFYIVKLKADGSDEYLSNDWQSNTKTPINISEFTGIGKLRSLVDAYGYGPENNKKGLFPEMLDKLDAMAKAFAEEFNKIHKGDEDPNHPDYPQGSDINGKRGEEFFVPKEGTGITAANISVSAAIISDPGKIVASDSKPVQQGTQGPEGTPEPGNGKFALKLATMKFKQLSSLDGVSVQSYFEGIIGQLGVDGEQAERLTNNTAILQQAVSERRAAVSSVSLDEEMTNMITFQQAYNANARMITVIDEMLEKIINGLGRVGL